MHITLPLPNNISLINFSPLLQNVGIRCVNELYDFNLLNNKIKLNNPDIKRIIMNSLIYYLCESIVNNPMNKKVIILQNDFNSNNELNKYFDNNKLSLLILRTLKLSQKLLPIPIFKLPIGLNFNYFDDNNFWNTGEGKDLLNLIIALVDKFENKSFNFSKIKKITNDIGLTFLSNQYFNELKVKQHLVA